jgi:hypothetical protein
VGLDGEWRTETRRGGTPSVRSRPVGGLAAGVEDPGTGFPLPALFFLVTALVAGILVYLLVPGRLPLDRLDPWTLTDEGEREMFPPEVNWVHDRRSTQGLRRLGGLCRRRTVNGIAP